MDILKYYLPLSWFKGNPLDLPKSIVFFKYNLIFNYFVGLFLQFNMIDDPLEAFSDVTFETLLTLIFIFTLLSLNASMAWFIQVGSAILVGKNVVACIALPILAWVTVSESLISYIFLALLVCWELLFLSYIFKQVLGINRFASLIIGVVYFIVTYLGVFGINVLLAL
ncbi:MAG: hypothetical protein NTV00_04770 [Methylococcales bacterium]|nr:hypothetical protein [Methylococcales bacterium]